MLNGERRTKSCMQEAFSSSFGVPRSAFACYWLVMVAVVPSNFVMLMLKGSL
jgi:hypothetical protein